MKTAKWIAVVAGLLVAAVCVAAPPDLPKLTGAPKVAPKVEAPKSERLTCTDGSVIEWTGSAWRVASSRQVILDNSSYPGIPVNCVVLQNVGASAQSPTNGGCYINANGQKVCPAKR